MKTRQAHNKNVAYPPYIDFSSNHPGVLSVELEEDEDVQWHWTHYPDGTSVVTGYTIIRKAGNEHKHPGRSKSKMKRQFLLSRIVRMNIFRSL
jgi:hypothetical protein